jgi:hypothetical protein
VVERTAFGAATGKTNLDHIYLLENLSGTVVSLRRPAAKNAAMPGTDKLWRCEPAILEEVREK